MHIIISSLKSSLCLFLLAAATSPATASPPGTGFCLRIWICNARLAGDDAHLGYFDRHRVFHHEGDILQVEFVHLIDVVEGLAGSLAACVVCVHSFAGCTRVRQREGPVSEASQATG